MINKQRVTRHYFILTLFLSVNLFGAERILPLNELLLQRRMGTISSHEFARELAGMEVVPFIDETLSEQDIQSRRSFDERRWGYDHVFRQKIAKIRDRISQIPSSLRYAIPKLSSLAPDLFLKDALCDSFLQGVQCSVNDEILRSMFQEHGLDVNSHVAYGGRHSPLWVPLSNLRPGANFEGAREGNLARIRMLLEAGADMDRCMGPFWLRNMHDPIDRLDVEGRFRTAREWLDYQISESNRSIHDAILRNETHYHPWLQSYDALSQARRLFREHLARRN